mmetsp:Transcript_34530/g.33723  ORF Transcript_34530/g.33723 Transcript_34530/m.33723 type:complete len:94 (+) Transcript_34530:1195-1476(+)
MCHYLYRLFREEINEEKIQMEEFGEEFMKLKANFEKLSIKVFKLLSNFKNYHQSSPYLSQLLLRIDYNNYFTLLSEKIEKETNKQMFGKKGLY